MTSNIGAQHIDRMEKLGFSRESGNRDRENYVEAKAKVMSSLKDYFRPEFLNRVDDTIIFDILSPQAIQEIVRIQVDQVVKRLAEKSVTLNLSPAVYEYLGTEGYNPQYGARPLKRLIQSKILTPVANLMISQEVTKGGTIEVGVKAPVKNVAADAPVEFTFEVKKKVSPSRNASAERGRGESPIVMSKAVAQK
jgi:ATP-dependent Clp protease ATP-binding subunit ClpC